MIEKWIWFGYLPPYARRDNKNHFVGRVPPEQYFRALQAQPFSYLWKPLKECRQNDGKSNISWIEATLCGAVCVTNYASRTGWENTFATFEDARDGHAEMLAASRVRILDEFNINHVNHRRVERLMELAGKNVVTT